MSEKQKLIDAVDWFAAQMKEKLTAKSNDGFSGWDDPKWLGSVCPHIMLNHAKQLYCGDLDQAVDVANLAMFIAYANREKKNES